MIEQITLKNIQKHDNLTLNFVSGVNVISGATDTGKTAIFRGLIWALMNEGESNKLIKHGANKCSVTVTIDDNVIERAWSSSSNTYKLNGSLFKSFRTSVPGDIAKLVNMAPISIQSRRDLPFMVYYKGSETAEQFSTMLDLNEIQTVTSNTNKYVKDIQRNYEEAKEKLAEVREELKHYSGIDAAVEAVNRMKMIETKLHLKQHEIERLTEISKAEYNTRCIMARNEQYVDAEADLRHIEEYSHLIAEKVFTMQKIELICNQWALEQKKAEIASQLSQFAPKLEEIDEIRKKLRDRTCGYNKLSDLLSKFKKSYLNAKALKDNIATLTEQLNAFRGTICPTCGQVIETL